MFYTVAQGDECGDVLRWEGVEPKKWITKWARKRGWTIGKKVTCLHCRITKKEAKE